MDPPYTPIPKWKPALKDRLKCNRNKGPVYHGLPDLDTLSRKRLQAFYFRYGYPSPRNLKALLGSADTYHKQILDQLVLYVRFRLGYELAYAERVYMHLPEPFKFRTKPHSPPNPPAT